MSMKAVFKSKPEPGLELKQTDIPKIKPHEVLVKVKATSICGTDVHIYNWDEWSQKRIKPPQIMGHEFCGDIVEAGKDVKALKQGDFVTSETHIVCGTCAQCKTGNAHICKNTEILGVDRHGTFAEYVAIPEYVAWKLDKSIPIERASVMEPFGNAVHATLACDDVSGKSVAIFGAGPTGLFSVAVAKVCGAYPVIVSEINKYRMDLAKKMGADIVIDANDDKRVIKEFMDITNNKGVDVSLIMSGAQIAFTQGFKVLRNGGRISLFGIPSKDVTLDIANDIIFKGIKAYGIVGRKMFSTWYKASTLLKKVNIDPIITHKFKLDQAKEALELMKSTNSGKIVLYPK